MTKAPTPPNGNWTEWFKLVMLGLNILMIPLLIWGVQMEVRISTMEGNRYTSQDALVDQRLQDTKMLEHATAEGHPVVLERVEEILRRLDAE